MMGATLGLLGSAQKAPAVLSALASVAAPGARIIGGGGFAAGDDPVHLAYHQRNRAAGRLPGALRIRTRFRNLADPWVELLLCTPDELAELLAGSPWELVCVDGGPAAYLAELRLR